MPANRYFVCGELQIRLSLAHPGVIEATIFLGMVQLWTSLIECHTGKQADRLLGILWADSASKITVISSEINELLQVARSHPKPGLADKITRHGELYGTASCDIDYRVLPRRHFDDAGESLDKPGEPAGSGKDVFVIRDPVQLLCNPYNFVGEYSGSSMRRDDWLRAAVSAASDLSLCVTGADEVDNLYRLSEEARCLADRLDQRRRDQGGAALVLDWDVTEDELYHVCGLIDELFDNLSDLAPEDVWFGCNPDDPASVGFWKFEEESEEEE